MQAQKADQKLFKGLCNILSFYCDLTKRSEIASIYVCSTQLFYVLLGQYKTSLYLLFAKQVLCIARSIQDLSIPAFCKQKLALQIFKSPVNITLRLHAEYRHWIGCVLLMPLNLRFGLLFKSLQINTYVHNWPLQSFSQDY